MKILLVITKAEIGGAQNFVLSLARGLKKSGIEVSVAAGDGDILPKELEKENIPFIYLKYLNRSFNLFSIFAYIRELKKIINQESFEVIHLNSTNTLPGVFAAKLSKGRPKVVFTVHGLSVIDKNYKSSGLVKIIFKYYFKFFIKFVDKLIFVSKDNLVEAKGRGIKKAGSIIYYGLEMTPDYFLNKDEAKRRIEKMIGKKLEGAYLIGSIGRLAEQKNYDFIIKIWSEIKKEKPSAKFVVIGEGPERVKYEKIIRESEGAEEIYLPGEMKNASCLLKAFDLFILPSIYEGLPISLIEALFSDIPILASDVGGNREIIGIENCFKFNDDRDFLSKLRRGANVNIDKTPFGIDYMVEEYIKIYDTK